MKRIPEPELMDDDQQARAYDNADFSAVNQDIVDHFCQYYPDNDGLVLDIGTGPADIPLRLQQKRSSLTVIGLDDAYEMLRLGNEVSDEISILSEEFYHSLLAAFTTKEVERLLSPERSHLSCDKISDRHWKIAGSK